jgi:hypothetical protein
MKSIKIYSLAFLATVTVYAGCEFTDRYDPICPTGSTRNKWSENVDGVVFQGELSRQGDASRRVFLSATVTNNSDMDAVIVGATLVGEQGSLQTNTARDETSCTVPAHTVLQRSFGWDLPKGQRGRISDYLGERLSITWQLALGGEQHAIHVEMLSHNSQASYRYGWLRFVGSVGLALLTVALMLKVYFYPSSVAKKTNHPSREVVFALNLLIGWTGIGWMAVMEMANNSQKTNANIVPSAFRPFRNPNRTTRQ